MPTKEDEISAIANQRDEARKAIVAKNNSIQDRMNTIVDAARNRGFTKGEKAELNDLNVALKANLDADRDIQLVTVTALENSASVKSLIDTVQKTNNDLKSAFSGIQSVSQTIKDINDVVGKINTLIIGLTALLALF